MLTIVAPIEIKAKTTYVKDPETFYHRIVGNYSLMETRIDQEDLLHIAATPPEIYVQEGEGMTSIISNTQRNENNLNKVEILNNVINRIVVSADANLSYQDRIFITDALYKLGIKDDRRFMKAFYQIAEETKNTNTLINLYLERGGEIRELFEEVITEKDTKSETVRESTETERENFLYSSVMKRLQTGAIYQIISNFNRTIDENSIDSTEYSIANQSYTAQHILLSRLRNETTLGDENLFYLSENTYDESVENEQSVNNEVRNELTAAVLMDMVKNIYHTAYDRLYTGGDTYYRFEDTFFKASDQTFLRLIGAPVNEFIDENTSVENYYQQSNEISQSEISLLENAQAGELSEENIERITETINAINVQNERRRREYEKYSQRVNITEREADPKEGFTRTIRDAELALTNPGKLMEKLREQEEKKERKRGRILNELRHVIPDQSMEIYDLLEQYYQGDTNVYNNNFVRPAEVGELIFDINRSEVTAEAPAASAPKRDPETQQFLDEIKKAKQSEKAGITRSSEARGPAETIHRRNETLTTEELNEQLNAMESNIQRQINKTVETTVVNETKLTQENLVRTNNVKEVSLTARDIEKLVENQVKSRMNTISNQVINKLEKQMKNEKMRRGY